MPIHTYTNWNSRPSDNEEQIEPFRKYFFICEGANTETFYFKHLVDMRKQLGIHPMIDIRLWEKAEETRTLSFAKTLAIFAEEEKAREDEFDPEHDKMVIVFDGDIFEEKVEGYDELISYIEGNNNIVGVTNPGFELFLLLHIADSYNNYIKVNEDKFLIVDEKSRYSYAEKLFRQLTGMNPKKNPKVGELAENVLVAIEQEKHINQDIHEIKGKISSNIGKIIESIINEIPDSL